ncbi:MAG: PQQ-binding-like beta-propeller repeat protein, partial [Verrucomicrobiota bacterium]
MPERLPGMDRQNQTEPVTETTPFAKSQFTTGTGKPGTIPGEWPGFRGAKGDNLAAGTAPLARQWKELWRVDLGEGYAGAAVRNGRVYVLDYDQARQADALRCLSLADGQEIWRFSYPVKTKRNHGMSRTVPTVTDRYVVAFGPKCHVICLDALTGQFQWGLDLVKEFNAEVPQWYAGLLTYNLLRGVMLIGAATGTGGLA